MSYFPNTAVPQLTRAAFIWGPAPTTSPGGSFGPLPSAAGGGQVQVPASPSSILAGHYRIQFTTGTGANAVAGLRATVQTAHVTSGFKLKWRFACETYTAGHRGFLGLYPSLPSFPAAASEPSALVNIIAFAFDSTHTTWQVMHNDGSGTATQVNTTLAINATDLMEGELSMEPGSSIINWSLRNVSTGARASGTTSSNIPAVTSPLALCMQANAAATGAIARLTHLLMSIEVGPS